METIEPITVDEILHRAALIGQLIASDLAEPDLRQHAADYGRCVYDQSGAIPEKTRRGFALALTQPLVIDVYTRLDLDTLRQPGLRSLARAQIALSVLYLES